VHSASGYNLIWALGLGLDGSNEQDERHKASASGTVTGVGAHGQWGSSMVTVTGRGVLG
jgi:hypothetical protein